jgi:hypothetical protein
MKIRLTLDRFEGEDKRIAVLVDDDGRPINVARDLLPRDAQAGDVLAVTFERDLEATRRIAAETRRLQEDLQKTDPGGDLTL